MKMEKKKKKNQTAAVVMLCLRGASHSYFIEYIALKPGLFIWRANETNGSGTAGRKERKRAGVSAMAERRRPLATASWLHRQ